VAIAYAGKFPALIPMTRLIPDGLDVLLPLVEVEFDKNIVALGPDVFQVPSAFGNGCA
jgi:hypothetical protein